jgi:galactokinase
VTADIDALRRIFEHEFNRPAAFVSEAPGRVNLIGEHTDYNEGYVLPVAIDRTVGVAAAGGGDAVRVYTSNLEARDEWRTEAPRRTGRGEWLDYVRGVAWALLDAGHELLGADLVIGGDVPQGSGLSSSAALEVALGGALLAVSEVEVEPQTLALLCQRAENQFVGVQCGLMDQLTAACARDDHALLIDCRSLTLEHVALPGDVAIIVVESGVKRRLDDTAYNLRRQECSEAARRLGLPSLRDIEPEALDKQSAHLPELLARRTRHVVNENRRVIAAAECLRERDVEGFGRLMYESHVSLRTDFEVSTPELDLLVELASQAGSVLGARLTGAGFGGCTVNLIVSGAEGRFKTEVLEVYRRKTGLPAQMHVCRAVRGLEVRSV